MSTRPRPTGSRTATAQRERAPRITDYFPVRRLPRITGVDNKFWQPAHWKRADIEQVRLDGLYATQPWISRNGLAHHRRPGARPDGGELPWVVAHQGRNYLIDGHHRACCSLERGETHIRARVRRTP
jgi:hypothetical protein